MSARDDSGVPPWAVPDSPAYDRERPPRGDPRRRTWLSPAEVEREQALRQPGYEDVQHQRRLPQPEEPPGPQLIGEVIDILLRRLEARQGVEAAHG